MNLTTGTAYDVSVLRVIGWTRGDGTGSEGYNIADYFDGEGRYLGPDQHGIEPIVEGRIITTNREITVRAKAFSGRGVETITAMVDSDGTVRVYDAVAGYYTTCHSLSQSAQQRIRKAHAAA